MNGPDFIQNLPLDKLAKSPCNARRTPASEAAEVELRASIAVHGLQQNLVVTPANGEGVHEVIAGSRRLAALKALRSEEHTSELQSLMRISYAVFCLKKKKNRH